MAKERPSNLMNLSEMLPLAEKGGFAIGSFSARYTAMILPILQAAQELQSPLIVQISQNEFNWFGNSPKSFADEFYHCLEAEGITVPVGLHLDHTKELEVIKAAIAAGFTSVMIDASELPLDENIAKSRRVASIAHTLGLAVEAELGRITTTDKLETEDDIEMYTQPEEAGIFVERTQVDALAVSVGTAHGVYTVKQPKIDYERLLAIRARTPVHLVLHGGSGVPPEMMRKAYTLPGGGVSKINIATDLEMAALAALGSKRMTDAEMSALPPERLELARASVKAIVMDKMEKFLDSAGKALPAMHHG
jgi:ketose-bisphosphate aldolase